MVRIEVYVLLQRKVVKFEEAGNGLIQKNNLLFITRVKLTQNMLLQSLKRFYMQGTVSVISSDPPGKVTI